MTITHQMRAIIGIALACSVFACGRSTQAEVNESKGAWVYNSETHGFSLKLPSSNWKEASKRQHIADLWNNRFGSPMLAGVFSVKKQTKAKFQDLAKEFKKEEAKRDGDLLVKPTIQEGVNEAGNPYIFEALCEKGNGREQYIYVARSYMWIKEKEVTVEVFFEGQRKMRSKFFKSIEYSEFEKAAKSICLSVDKAKKSPR